MPKKRFVHNLVISDEQASWLKNAFDLNVAAYLQITRNEKETITTVFYEKGQDFGHCCFFLGLLMATILVNEEYTPVPKAMTQQE